MICYVMLCYVCVMFAGAASGLPAGKPFFTVIISMLTALPLLTILIRGLSARVSPMALNSLF